MIVKSTIKYCENKQHFVEDVIAKLQVKKMDDTIVWNHIHAAYCHDCCRYYVLNADYEKLEGIPLCSVVRIIIIRKYQ